MLVDAPSGPLARLIPRLKELDFRIIRVPDALAALDFVRSFPKLSMVAMTEGHEPDADRQALTAMRELQPGLPLLWHGTPDRVPGGVNVEILPRNDLTAGDLVACAERLLCEHFYPSDFTAYLAEAALGALSAFGTHASSADPCLKASRARLGELSAVIAFSGSETAGHLVVSSSRDFVRAAHARLFGEAESADDDALVDLLGECANRIIGRMAAYFEKQGRQLTFGLPIFLAGSHCVLWQGTPRPSLALEFEGIGGRLFAELCIDAFDMLTPQSDLPDTLFHSGQCILL